MKKRAVNATEITIKRTKNTAVITAIMDNEIAHDRNNSYDNTNIVDNNNRHTRNNLYNSSNNNNHNKRNEINKRSSKHDKSNNYTYDGNHKRYEKTALRNIIAITATETTPVTNTSYINTIALSDMLATTTLRNARAKEKL